MQLALELALKKKFGNAAIEEWGGGGNSTLECLLTHDVLSEKKSF